MQHGGAVYDPSVFTRVQNLEAAKRIILTPEKGLSTDERWQRETPHICDLIDSQMQITGDTMVMDYGCGVGRLAKELIRRHRCRVIGVDISPNMLGLAASYVYSDRFMGCGPTMVDVLDLQANVVIAVWTLQHIAQLDHALMRMEMALRRKGGWLFVVNEANHRCVPSNQGWLNDGINVRQRLIERFGEPVADGKLSEAVVGEQSGRTFWAAHYKTGAS